MGAQKSGFAWCPCELSPVLELCAPSVVAGLFRNLHLRKRQRRASRQKLTRNFFTQPSGNPESDQCLGRRPRLHRQSKQLEDARLIVHEEDSRFERRLRPVNSDCGAPPLPPLPPRHAAGCTRAACCGACECSHPKTWPLAYGCPGNAPTRKECGASPTPPAFPG